MPVVLDDAQLDDWTRGPSDEVAVMMKPYAGEIEAWQVPTEVGNVKNNRPELMERWSDEKEFCEHIRATAKS